MNAYEINSGYQKHIVIAETIGQAEEEYNAKYGSGQAVKIEKIADYVQIYGLIDRNMKKP